MQKSVTSRVSKSSKKSFEQLWKELCESFENAKTIIIRANTIYKHEGFADFLLSNNYAIVDSRITVSLTDLARKKQKIQDENYKKICRDIQSMVHILVDTGTENEPHIEKTLSRILYIALDSNEEISEEYNHFLNLFKNCIKHTHADWHGTDEYTISEELFESFCFLFPDFIDKLRQDSFNCYAMLLEEKEPYDKKLKEIERQINQKMNEMLQNRISHVLLPSGKRLEVIYEVE